MKKTYRVEKFNYGLFDSFFRFVRKKPKVFILIVSSLILTLTLIIVVPLLKDQMEVILEKKNESRFKYVLYKSYMNLCNMKRNFLIENYIFLASSLPLTIFLYFWNSFQLSRKPKLNKKKKQKSSSTPVKSEETNLSSDSDSDVAKPNIESVDTKESLDKSQKKLRCQCNFKLLVPMNPFSKTNRFITCIIYAAYIHNISKIFESSFSNGFDYLSTITSISDNQTNDTGN